jgi:hypothetical protein
MKKILLLMMCCPLMLAAQNGNGVTVSNLNVSAGTVTFDVSWKKADMPTLWSDSVWVFVDYNNAGRMERLPVTSATATAGTIEKISGNDKGVRVIGNARDEGNFSATVQLFSEIKDVVGACAFASNYPPVGEYTAGNNLKFTGTPPYELVLDNGDISPHTYSINNSYYTLIDPERLVSFSDKTGMPGNISGIPFSPPLAASTQTFKFGSSTLTWSDRITGPAPGCVPGRAMSPYDNITREFCSTMVGDQHAYYYTGGCLYVAAAVLCPTPWRVPTLDEYNTIPPFTAADLELPTLAPWGMWEYDQWVRRDWRMESCGPINYTGSIWVVFNDNLTMSNSGYNGSTEYGRPLRCVKN